MANHYSMHAHSMAIASGFQRTHKAICGKKVNVDRITGLASRTDCEACKKEIEAAIFICRAVNKLAPQGMTA